MPSELAIELKKAGWKPWSECLGRIKPGVRVIFWASDFGRAGLDIPDSLLYVWEVKGPSVEEEDATDLFCVEVPGDVYTCEHESQVHIKIVPEELKQ